MEKTTIKVVVKLTIVSNEKLTEAERGQVVFGMDYNFSFSELLDGNPVSILDTEIIDTLES